MNKIGSINVGYGKSINLNALPPEAWTAITGESETGGGKHLSAVAYAYRAYVVRCNALASMPWDIRPVGNPDAEPVWSDGQRAPAALEWLSNLPALVRKTEAQLIMYGRSYWHIERNLVRTLRVRDMRPDTVTPEFGDNGDVSHFERADKSRRMRLEPEEVVYFWLPDPNVEIGPPKMYPLKAAEAAIMALHNLDEFAGLYFKRGLLKTPLVATSGFPGDSQQEVKSWFDRAARGVASAFRPLFVRGNDVTVSMLDAGLGEISDGAFTDQLRQDITTAFGIPHSVVMSNSANYATANQEWVSLYDTTIVPQAEFIAQVINAQLLEALGYELTFAPERLEAYQASELSKAEALQRLVGGAVMSVNEARARLELEPVPDGDTIMTPMAQASMQADAAQARASAMQGPRQPTAEPAAVDTSAEPPDADAKAWDAGRSADLKRFRRWYGDRLGGNVAEFDSPYLSHAEKVIQADLLLRRAMEAYP